MNLSPDEVGDLAQVLLSDGNYLKQMKDSLREWVDEARKSLKQELNPFEGLGRGVNQTIPVFFLLLRECVLNQRWHVVTEVIYSLLGETSANTNVLFTAHKVAAEVVYQGDGDGDHLLKLFTQELRGFKGTNFLHVVLEYILHLMTQDRLAEANKIRVTSQRKVDAFKNRNKKEETDHWDMMLTAYQGLIYYSNWKTCKLEYSEIQQNDNPLHLGESVVTVSASMTRFADKATECFDTVLEKHGVWNVFLPAYIEIFRMSIQVVDTLRVKGSHLVSSADRRSPAELKLLEEYDRKYDALQLMETAIEKSPDNLWPKLQLYSMYEDQHVEKIKLLKAICAQDPSHCLVMDLFMKLKQTGDVHVSLLFELLDYPYWQHKAQPWTLLSDQLLEYNGKLSEDVVECWSSRSSWWPQLHFSQHNLLSSTKETQECKIVTALILLDKDGKHMKIVKDIWTKEHLSSDRISRALKHD